jgi:hypothetical protein
VRLLAVQCGRQLVALRWHGIATSASQPVIQAELAKIGHTETQKGSNVELAKIDIWAKREAHRWPVIQADDELHIFLSGPVEAVSHFPFHFQGSSQTKRVGLFFVKKEVVECMLHACVPTD